MRARNKDNLKKQLVLHLTPEQKGIIQQCTGSFRETLNLEDCGDRLTIGRTCETVTVHEITGNQDLVLELTDEQKEQLRCLTGKIFSQLRIRRRRG